MLIIATFMVSLCQSSSLKPYQCCSLKDMSPNGKHLACVKRDESWNIELYEMSTTKTWIKTDTIATVSRDYDNLYVSNNGKAVAFKQTYGGGCLVYMKSSVWSHIVLSSGRVIQLAMSGNGDTLAFNVNAVTIDSGMFTYVRNGNEWKQIEKLHGEFWRAVISEDGYTMVVAEEFWGQPSKVKVYKRTSTHWIEQTTLPGKDFFVVFSS